MNCLKQLFKRSAACAAVWRDTFGPRSTSLLGLSDYDRAREELVIARRTLPNESRIPLLAGYINRRQGQLGEIAGGNEAGIGVGSAQFFYTPANLFTYEALRHYKEMAETLDHALAIAPKDIPSRVRRASVDLESHAQTETAAYDH